MIDYDGQVIFQKQSNDVRTNPNVAQYLRAINPSRVVVYGVVSEIRVDKAVEFAASDLGYKVFVVIDAIKKLNQMKYRTCLKRWRSLRYEQLLLNELVEAVEDSVD